MPKRTLCTNCRDSLHHQRKFQTIEVVGTGSGQSKKMIAQICEVCHNKQIFV